MTEVAGAGRAVALSQAIKVEARRLGFDHCRITPVAEAPHAGFFSAWLAHGRAGEMAYLTHHVEKRRDPARLAEPGAPAFRSLIVLGVNHFQFALPPAAQADPSRGLIASYAWGDDYHEIIRPQLYALDGYIRRQTGRTTQGKCLVDTGPVLERDWAQAAGIGFTGKNCCTIHPADGSWLLLATLLVPELLVADPPPRPVQAPELPPDAVARGLVPSESVGSWQLEANGESALATCGRCTRCLDACPTHAFVGPFHLDPQRCISYWTIEAKGPIPRMLRPHFGNRIFGCDICQEVCPWNQRLPARTPLLAGLAAQEERIAPPLLEGFSPANPYWLDEGAFRARFRRSPLLRAKRRGMLRNVCVALGNWADPQATPALLHALRDPEPLARGHAAWALGQIYRRHGFEEAKGALAAASHAEHDAWVRDEIANALAVD
ncbi:MAG: DUF1730 domain-containing protein [Caldilineaceae bacterium]|nr:DUF1730 domain-containing protein [Caldilineaceae bacterium]